LISYVERSAVLASYQYLATEMAANVPVSLPTSVPDKGFMVGRGRMCTASGMVKMETISDTLVEIMPVSVISS
jgi:hypothetical protein